MVWQSRGRPFHQERSGEQNLTGDGQCCRERLAASLGEVAAPGRLQEAHARRHVPHDAADVAPGQAHGRATQALHVLASSLPPRGRPGKLLSAHAAVDLSPDAAVQRVEVGRPRWQRQGLNACLGLGVQSVTADAEFLLEQAKTPLTQSSASRATQALDVLMLILPLRAHPGMLLSAHAAFDAVIQRVEVERPCILTGRRQPTTFRPSALQPTLACKNQKRRRKHLPSHASATSNAKANLFEMLLFK